MNMSQPYTPLLPAVAPYVCIAWNELPTSVQDKLQAQLLSWGTWDQLSPKQRTDLCWQHDQQRDPAREPVLYASMSRVLSRLEALAEDAKSQRQPVAESMVREAKELIGEVLWQNRTVAGEELRELAIRAAQPAPMAQNEPAEGHDPRELRTVRVILGALAKDSYGDSISSTRISNLKELVADLERKGVRKSEETISGQIKKAVRAYEEHLAETSAKID